MRSSSNSYTQDGTLAWVPEIVAPDDVSVGSEELKEANVILPSHTDAKLAGLMRGSINHSAMYIRLFSSPLESTTSAEGSEAG